MSSPAASREQVQDFLSDAASWRLLGLLFERPAGDWRAEVGSVASEIQDPELRAAAKSATKASEGQYLDLLGPGGLVSPREVAYRGREDPSRILSDVNAFYEAFGFSPRTEDTADHISTELGFLSFLEMKQAYARAAGDSESLGVTTDALSKFVSSHLEGFVEPFADRIRAIEGCDLVDAASVLAERFHGLLSRLPVTKKPRADRSRTEAPPVPLINILGR